MSNKEEAQSEAASESKKKGEKESYPEPKTWTVRNSEEWKECVAKEKKIREKWTNNFDKTSPERRAMEDKIKTAHRKQVEDEKERKRFQAKILFAALNKDPSVIQNQTVSTMKSTFGQNVSPLKSLGESHLMRNEMQKLGEDKMLIYDGISKEGKGRQAYLTLRSRQSPTKKHRLPLTSSQEVGWLADGYRTERTDNGRKAIIAHTTYNHSRDNLHL